MPSSQQRRSPELRSHTAPPAPRLLPWSNTEGNPCFLSSDGTGYLWRVADDIEAVQLGMAGELLDHAADLLDDDRVTADQLRFTLARMSESLRDVKRVADSRGARLPEAGATELDLDQDDAIGAYDTPEER